MTWAIFFAPVAVSAAVMLFASVVLTEEADERPARASFFERDDDSDLEPMALSVQRPHDASVEASEGHGAPSHELSEREPRRIIRGIVDSSRDRAVIPPPPSASRGGFDESERDGEVTQNSEELSPEEKRARTAVSLRVMTEKLPHLKNLPGFGALKRLRDESESEAEAPPSGPEPAVASSLGGARGR